MRPSDFARCANLAGWRRPRMFVAVVELSGELW